MNESKANPEVDRWLAETKASLARNATLLAEPPSPARLAALMRQYGGTGRAPAAEPANELGQAKPWSEILQKLGYAKPAGSASGVAAASSRERPAITSGNITPSVATEQTATGERALPWKEVLAQVEAEGRPTR